MTYVIVLLSAIFIICLFFKTGILVFTAVSAALVFIIYFLIDLKGRRISMKKEEQLEVFLMDLITSLHANPNVLSAIKNAADCAEEPLKKEFELVVDDTRKGVRLSDALENMLSKNRSIIIQVIITGFIAANDKGVDLVEFLQDQVSYIREKRSMESYIRILSSGPRYTSYVIALIPVAVLFIASLLNRDFALSLTSGTGAYIIIYAMASYLLGFVLINKIVNLVDISDRSIK